MLFVERTVLYNAFVTSSSPHPSDNADGADVTGAPTPTDGDRAGVIPTPPRARRHRRPTRRTAITLEAIVAAAVQTVDESGVAGLTMRRVADRLGTGPASLYAHVSGRDELLELTFDELLGQVPLASPEAGRWREQTTDFANELYRILTSHSDAALAGFGRVPTSPKALDAGEALATVMSAGGLTDRVVALGLDQLLLYVCATAFEDGVFAHGGMSAEDEDRYRADIDLFYANLPAERFPTIARLHEVLTEPDDEARFRFGLEMLLAGLQALSDAERAGS
jgi:AcrR family transcriptional regulator